MANGNVKKRSVGLAILFTIITFGIYGIYWFICLTNDSNKISHIKTAGGGVAFLLTLVTFGIYGLYWYYKLGQKIKAYDGSSSGAVHLLLGLFGLGIISYALAQSALNKYAEA